MTNTAKTVTVVDLVAALEDAGISVWEGAKETRIYDPAKRGAYSVIDDGYSNPAKGLESYPDFKFGKVRGGFAAQLRQVRDSLL